MDNNGVPDNSERRTLSRIDSLNFVSYQYFDSENNVEVEEIGRTLDISLGGIKLEVPLSKVPSSEIKLYIALEEAVINVKGEVAHVDEHDNGCCEVGIRFVEISHGDQVVIEKFLRDIKISS